MMKSTVDTFTPFDPDNETGYLAQTLLCEEVGRGSSSLRVAFNTQCLGTALSILRHGSAEQKQRWIPDLIKANKLGCFAISEPNSGSDVMSMTTTAATLALFYEMILAGGTMADGTRLIRTETLEHYLERNVSGYESTGTKARWRDPGDGSFWVTASRGTASRS